MDEINIEEAAKIFHKGEDYVLLRIQDGRLSHRYDNGQCLLSKAEVEAVALAEDDAKIQTMMLQLAVIEYQRGTLTLQEAIDWAEVSDAEFAKALGNATKQ